MLLLFGFGKITNYGAAVGYMGSLGLPAPSRFTLLAIVIEIGGGLLMLVGLSDPNGCAYGSIRSHAILGGLHCHYVRVLVFGTDRAFLACNLWFRIGRHTSPMVGRQS